MSAQLRSWAAALGGEVSGSGIICPGPGHSASDRSLSVTPSAAAPAGFLVHSFSPGDVPIAYKDYARARLGLSPFRPGREPKAAPQLEPKPVEEARQAPDNREAALNIWRQAIDPRGTLVEQYLKSRALELPDEAANEAVRFLPDCVFGSERFPAMTCLVRNIVTNDPQAIHRTALAANGTAIKRNGKTFRLSLGPIAGGAIKLDPDDDVTQGLCIGEGVETCLSGRQMGLRPVWSLVSTGGIAAFPILPGIEGLHIFRENDVNGASAKAVEACARRWYEAGRDVFVITPDVGDLNDELREGAA
ncbi:MAG: toprim domain-containing protein [Pseudomonadota bacterium]|nr:toprim domain-containing protein [Pseudomonadota bacterium]